MTEQTEMTNGIVSKSKVGRKPIADKKVAITIYRPKSNVEKAGGLINVRKLLNQFMDNQ